MPEPVRLWHDDIRPAPDGWVWARTNGAAQEILLRDHVGEISLDHDLGLHHFSEAEIAANQELLFGRGSASETGYDLVNWMIEHRCVPPRVTIHSWNPPGALAMAARLNRAGFDCAVVPFVLPKANP
jgi:NAD+-processing family protein with receiver domain